jgi:hypothetical protein
MKRQKTILEMFSESYSDSTFMLEDMAQVSELPPMTDLKAKPLDQIAVNVPAPPPAEPDIKLFDLMKMEADNKTLVSFQIKEDKFYGLFDGKSVEWTCKVPALWPMGSTEAGSVQEQFISK